MLELFFIVFAGFISFIVGVSSAETNYQEKCVAKYAEMPHNQVGDYCKKILKFEKDAK